MVSHTASLPAPGLMRSRGCYLRRRRDIAVLEPFNISVLLCFARRNVTQVRHEYLQTRIRCDTSVAAGQLLLVVREVQIKPGIFRDVDHDQVHVIHGQLAEVKGAAFQAQEVAPLFDAIYGFLAVAKDLFEVGILDPYFGEVSLDVRRGPQAMRIEEEIIAPDLRTLCAAF